MKTKLKKAWIEDLTSGKFTQASGQLHRVKPEEGRRSDRYNRAGYCCLGVLSCRLAKLKAVKETGWRWDGEQWVRGDVGAVALDLPLAVLVAAGLGVTDSDILIVLNDGTSAGEKPKSFAQIAKWIEKNVEVTP